MLGTDYLLDALATEGIDHLFIVPGGLVDPFLPAIGRQQALRVLVAAQEGGAAYMADGYARASGAFGAVLCIGGPGLGNTVTPTAAARSDGSPIIVLSGEVASALEGLGMFQDASAQTLDDVSVMKPVTLYSSSIDNPANLNHLVRRAIVAMRGIPAGPVHLSIPTDAQLCQMQVRHVRVGPPEPMLSTQAAAASLACFAKAGPKVVVLVGSGLEHDEGGAALRAFAEAWDIPVATTLRAKGDFPEDHPLSLGTFGYAGTHHARAAILDSPPDLLVVLGSGLNERDSMHAATPLTAAATIVVNADPAAVAQDAAACGVAGDVRMYLEWLAGQNARLAPSLDATRAARRAWLASIRAMPRLQDPDHQRSAAQPIHPARVVAELREALPRDGTLLVDSGAHRAFCGHYWTAYAPRTYISATNLGPMGWAIPAAIGVQCARPTSRIAVVTGDGCMHMHGIEVATAARYQLPIVYVVVNNAALGNVWLRAHTEGPVPDALTSLPDVDWAGFGKSLGCAGETVGDPAQLGDAFARALARSGPTVVDVKADKRYATPVADWAAASASWSYHE
jgi:acetolactate synthase-1/2/3 large subunit